MQACFLRDRILSRHPLVAQFAVILPAAGKSSRFKDPNYKKPYAPLADHITIRAVVDKLDGTDRRFEVVKLRRRCSRPRASTLTRRVCRRL